MSRALARLGNDSVSFHRRMSSDLALAAPKTSTETTIELVFSRPVTDGDFVAVAFSSTDRVADVQSTFLFPGPSRL